MGGQAFLVAQAHVDGVELVSEKLIALAVLRLLEMEKYVVEGGGATGLAAILPGGPLNIPELKGAHGRGGCVRSWWKVAVEGVVEGVVVVLEVIVV